MTDAAATHDDDLAEFGYKQELERSIGKFAQLRRRASATSRS